jgi:hypothetical protein
VKRPIDAAREFLPPPVHGEISLDATGKVCDLIAGFYVKAKRKIVRRASQDVQDRRELARAKKRNGGKAGTDWESVKKEFGFVF